MSITTGRQIPTTLSVVSYLFLIEGVLSVIEIVFSATRGAVHPDFGFLGLFIFGWLRRYSRGWRTCALVFIWIDLIFLAFVIGLVLYDGGAVWRSLSGREFVSIPLGWSLMMLVPFFVLVLWQYRVLTRPDIRSLFYGESQTAA